MRRLGLRRRLAAALVALAAAMLAVAGTVAPALAAGPSMAVTGYTGMTHAANVAVEGPNHSLLFYWQIDGTPTWNAETVAGPGTTYSEPAMVTDGGGVVDIAVMGPNNSLMFYSQDIGATTWTAETVAGPGTTYSEPAITADGAGTVYIAVEGHNGSLMLYSGDYATTYWSPETVESSGCCSAAPSITTVPYNLDVYITWTRGDSSQLMAAWATDGSVASPTPTWNFDYLIPYWAYSPTIVATDDTVFVSYTDGQGRIDLAQSADESNTWNFATVAGPGISSSAAPIAIGDGSMVIAATGLQGQLLFYWAGIGTPGILSFNAETVAGAGSAVSDPSLTLNENSVNISVIGTGGYLDFYWQIDGQSTWHPEGVTTGTGLPLP
jgi:hypothetical protein